MSDNTDIRVKLKNVRLSFPHVFEPKVGDDGGSRYAASFILDPNNDSHRACLSEFKKAIEKVSAEKWGDKVPPTVKMLKDRCFLKNGNDTARAEYADMYVVNTGGPDQPIVVGADRKPLTEEDGMIYGGCYVNAVVSVWAMDNKHGKRTCAALRGIQWASEGERFGRAPDTADDMFDDEVSDSDADELFGTDEAVEELDDDIPF